MAIGPSLAFTEKEIDAVFKALDEDKNGKISREEFDDKKVTVIYQNAPITNDSLTSGDVEFKQTKLSRAFFDSADVDKNGRLSPIEVTDALNFERIDRQGKGYLTKEDLQVFMSQIGR